MRGTGANLDLGENWVYWTSYRVYTVWCDPCTRADVRFSTRARLYLMYVDPSLKIQSLHITWNKNTELKESFLPSSKRGKSGTNIKAWS